LDRQSGISKSNDNVRHNTREDEKNTMAGKVHREEGFKTTGFNDEGGASRFFYSAKAQKSERNAGLEDAGFCANIGKESDDLEDVKNDIATLKPINLMRYLCRLVTPPDGTVLDPFAGSGTTGCACEVEGFDYILMEKRERFANVIAPKRCEYWGKEHNQKELKDHRELLDADGWMGTEEVPVDLLPEVRGIGEKTMESVKEHTQQISLNELKEVDGIGDKTIERIKDKIKEDSQDMTEEEWIDVDEVGLMEGLQVKIESDEEDVVEEVYQRENILKTENNGFLLFDEVKGVKTDE